MSETKTLLCLANSRKLSGRCIAGVIIPPDPQVVWVRPISDRDTEEVSEVERRYEDGSDPRVLDITRVPLLDHRPHSCQQENWLLDPGYYWSKEREGTYEELSAFRSAEVPLWTNGFSTRFGTNDKMPLGVAESHEDSLRLIQVESVHLRVLRPSADYENPKRRLQATFVWAGESYSLWVTDPDYEREYLGRTDEEHTLGECYLTISIGEPFHEYCSKLVAAIIERP